VGLHKPLRGDGKKKSSLSARKEGTQLKKEESLGEGRVQGVTLRKGYSPKFGRENPVEEPRQETVETALKKKRKKSVRKGAQN